MYPRFLALLLVMAALFVPCWAAKNAAPTVSITSPTNNTVFPAPASITIQAIAGDSDGTVSKVVFYNGTRVLSTDTTSPYSYTWTNVATGSYTLKAVATDNKGTSTTSTVVNIVVNVPPTVSLTSPANGSSFPASATVTLQATAADSDGTVSKVAFYQGSTLLSTDTSSPYSYSWANVPAGSYSLTAVATDNRGITTTSAAASITVRANALPTVAFTIPAADAVFQTSATMSLTATAADTDGTIARVSFYANETPLIADATAPYAYTWTNVPAGSYTLRAEATDNNGGIASSTIGITVNAPPTVTLTAPTGGATFTMPATITMEASAGDADDTVSKVEFYTGTTLRGTDTASPYTCAWTPTTVGPYSLTARAFDTRGGIITSVPVSVTITANSLPAVTLTAPRQRCELHHAGGHYPDRRCQ